MLSKSHIAHMWHLQFRYPNDFKRQGCRAISLSNVQGYSSSLSHERKDGQNCWIHDGQHVSGSVMKNAQNPSLAELGI